MDRKKQLATQIIVELKKLFPEANTALRYSNCWELLVAVILSAQCTDKTVNRVTEKLFKKYKSFDAYLKADPKEFEQDIKSTGFYRAKTKSVLGAAKIIREKFKNKIPDTMEELTTLPGVARKTANIVLYLCHGTTEGVAVDTHVKRLSKLYGLTDWEDPKKIEQDIMMLLPKKEWMNFTFRMIDYGRKYCPAIRHNHQDCPLVKVLLKFK